MNLYLLYLVSVLCDFLILIHVLNLKLSFHIELESFNEIFIRVFWLLSFFLCSEVLCEFVLVVD